MNEKMFDGLHGDITLICAVCNTRHRPRCAKPNALTLSEFARLGGKARAKKLTPEQRSAIAKKAVEARIKKLNQKRHGKKN